LADHRVQQTIDRMREQLHRRLTVRELADAVGLSVAQLTRIFRQATGTTPGAFLHAMRLQRARTLLERTSLSIGEVMAQVGISDRSHFARDFGREYGFSPRGLRQQFHISAMRRAGG
jgi:AraC family transcriptional regulator